MLSAHYNPYSFRLAQVFKAWHSKRTAEKRRQKDQAADDRRKKGMLTGREIFMQEGFTAQVRTTRQMAEFTLKGLSCRLTCRGRAY